MSPGKGDKQEEKALLLIFYQNAHEVGGGL